MGTFSLYGLSVESPIPLPELSSASSPSDVSIEYGDVAPPENDAVPDESAVSVEDGLARIFYPCVGSFEVRDGSTIVVDEALKATEQSIRSVILGPAIGFLLHQRGLLVLHGSTVERDGDAIVFLGEKGAGKSTLAGGFVDAGYNAVCDDVTVIDVEEGSHRVLPGRPHVKLAENHFGYEAFPTTASLEMEKQFYRVPQQTTAEQLRIRGFFAIDPSEEFCLERISGSESIWAVIQNLYLLQFSDAVHIDGCFEQVAELAEQVSIHRLKRPDDIGVLPSIVDTVKNVP